MQGLSLFAVVDAVPVKWYHLDMSIRSIASIGSIGSIPSFRSLLSFMSLCLLLADAGMDGGK